MQYSHKNCLENDLLMLFRFDSLSNASLLIKTRLHNYETILVLVRKISPFCKLIIGDYLSACYNERIKGDAYQ